MRVFGTSSRRLSRSYRRTERELVESYKRTHKPVALTETEHKQTKQLIDSKRTKKIKTTPLKEIVIGGKRYVCKMS